MTVEAPTVPTTWLSVSQAGRRIDRSAQTIRDMVNTGQLRAVQTPLGRLVDPASVDELLARRASKETATSPS